jgi:hypothetical protein
MQTADSSNEQDRIIRMNPSTRADSDHVASLTPIVIATCGLDPRVSNLGPLSARSVEIASSRKARLAMTLKSAPAGAQTQLTRTEGDEAPTPLESRSKKPSSRYTSPA